MSKSKKKNPQPVLLSPENYIRQKARTLPIAECFITPDWQDCGECNILVSRQHVNGNYTLGFYLIDAFCLGVKDAGYRFNIDKYEYQELKEHFGEQVEPTTYNEAHNIIFGALEYAEELGFKPHRDFGLARYILEQDTDDIPLIEYEFGKDGKPMLIVNTRAEANRYLPTLQKAVGDDYTLLIREEDEDFDDEDDDCDCSECRGEEEVNPFKNISEKDRARMLENLENMQKKFEKSQSLPHTTYNYQYPDYPQSLELIHRELEALFDPKNNEKLDKKTLDTILALPRESLIKDLENIILYEIGQNCREISKKNYDEDIYGTIAHALYLLAEVNATESLPIVLEVMRQSSDFYEFFFCDGAADIIAPVLYQIGKNQLPVLQNYLKEPSLSVHFKQIVLEVLDMITEYEPNRQSELIDLYSELFDFLLRHTDNTNYYDAGLAGMLIWIVTDARFEEFLPQIKCLFDTGQVDELLCGSYESIVRDIKKKRRSEMVREQFQTIYEIYK